MKTLKPIRFAQLAAAALFTHAVFAAKPGPTPPPPLENWQTVDDFQDARGNVNFGLTVAPSGALFAAGYADWDGMSWRGLVRTSTDGGNTWSLLDDFLYPGLYYTLYSDIASDSTGNLYLTGIAFDDGTGDLGGPVHWIVQRSIDGGASWSMVDDFVPGGEWWDSVKNTITVDAAGNVFVGIPANDGTPSSKTFWTIRRGVGGTDFTTVDTLPYDSDGPQGIYAHPTAGIFAVGADSIVVTNKNKTTSNSRAWTVRRSLNGGDTWAKVDTFQLSSGYQAIALGVGGDALGNIYVVGRGATTSRGGYISHWLVRKSADGGSSWSTVDDFLSSGNSAEARRFATDANGNLFVAGSGNTSTGYNYRWVVRKSAGGTGSWTTVDDFQYAGSGSTPYAIAADTYGKVFVGGAGGSHWLVRRSP
jgi:hypothetical protein